MDKQGLEVREAVVRLLEEKGYEVRDVSSGSGVPKLSRLEISKEDEKVTCAVKITTYRQGRISFTRNPDGTYKVLSDSDRVIYACPASDDDKAVAITMFDSSTVTQAFDSNFDARKDTDQESLPMWLSPALEPGQRFIGSGFQDDALWSEVAPLSGQTDTSMTSKNTTPPSEEGAKSVGIMERVKTMLSEHMGVRPDQLEVDVRVKL
ncbi:MULTISPECIES: hypothetical protein [unclassified Sulfitobacter]|uniref:hypothetical protein n=1 Tax=unclassified Sulfitobacter TaxID=196795 RepID=UPI0007C2F4A8|nr:MULTISPECIES: hypothetical protein [unclassified Sulfitobacter]KZX97304.1 hypothetical protein A3720_18395 [Sulfitobacter sp. HI0021]KZY04108.1 hypothetical protein A3722_19785 [Sulfitobacter sp. HI0027]KZZ00952.1 hypothetical protein A3747_20635 [Sulfitobacter sp. HI0076]